MWLHQSNVEHVMKIVIIGGTGRIGSLVVGRLRAGGHQAIPAAPNTGVNTLTGEGLAEALDGADVVVDVSNSPSFEDAAVLRFFETSTRNLLAAEAVAGVRHHVVLSVVGTGTEGVEESGYFRAKVVQENLIRDSSRPYSIVRATQFYEFIRGIADTSTVGDTVRVPAVLIQPRAAEDVASAVAKFVDGAPVNGGVEVAGPERFCLDELVRQRCLSDQDRREVIADPVARYFGARLREQTLLPGDGASLART